jgi:hypothetical protein
VQMKKGVDFMVLRWLLLEYPMFSFSFGLVAQLVRARA